MTRFRPGELWLDTNGVAINAHGGGILFHQGVSYWFGEHKVAGEEGNKAMVGVHAYSSRDLYGWHDEGIALPVSDDPASEIARGCVIERPKVVHCARTGKFVMWFHLELKGEGYASARAAVAISDTPVGPYRYLRSMRPNARCWPVGFDPAKLSDPAFAAYNYWLIHDFPLGQASRDMTLFVDGDGAAYHIFAAENNEALHIARLADDYLSHTGRFTRIKGDGSNPICNEAPAVFMKDGVYWLIASGCSGWTPNAARLYMAASVEGPWRFCGNPCAGPDYHVTFGAQSTFVLPVAEKPGTFIFMADRWCPENAIAGRYVWLPVQWRHGHPVVEWVDEWELESLGEAE